MIRGVRQLQKVTVKYCRQSGSSKGARALLQEGGLPQWCRENPDIQIETEVKAGRHPLLVAEFLQNEKVVSIRNDSSEGILSRLNALKDESGIPYSRFKKPVISSNPSLQGTWASSTAKRLQETEFKVELRD